MRLGSLTVSTVEYPGKTSLVIFTAGCTFRCPYCHNPELIKGGEEVEISEIICKIRDYAELVDAVVVSGGEPLLQIDEIELILREAQSLGLNTKLDTNGSFPENLKRITGLLDYVAIDIKAPFEIYRKLAGRSARGVIESLEILKSSDLTLECRTTFVPGLLDVDDIKKIADSIECDVYVLQQFRNRVVLDDKLKSVKPPSPEYLREIAKTVKDNFKVVKIRTEEFGEEEI